MKPSTSMVALGSLLTLLPAVSFLGGAPTYAFFSDSGASTGNTVVAGVFTECDTPGPDSFGYSCTPIVHSFEDISGTGRAVTLPNDAVSANITFGWNFRFYGVLNTNYRISSNGFIIFGSSAQGSGCCTGVAIPNAAIPNGIVAGWWEDLNPALGGSLLFEPRGTSPNRRHIVQFQDIQHHPGGSPSTFQFIFYEGNFTIVVNYKSALSDGGTHSAGIENQTGTVGLQYRFGDIDLVTRSVRYTLPGVSTLPSEPLPGPIAGEPPKETTGDAPDPVAAAPPAEPREQRPAGGLYDLFPDADLIEEPCRDCLELVVGEALKPREVAP